LNTPEKRLQITFRITETAMLRLEAAAELFQLTPAQYAKAVLYKDLGLFNEPLDQRRRSWKKQLK